MIGKKYVAAHRNAKVNPRSLRKFDERSVDVVVRQMRPSPISAAGYEIKGVVRKDNIQAFRCSREFCHDPL
jgi:hypothetical protein